MNKWLHLWDEGVRLMEDSDVSQWLGVLPIFVFLCFAIHDMMERTGELDLYPSVRYDGENEEAVVNFVGASWKDMRRFEDGALCFETEKGVRYVRKGDVVVKSAFSGFYVTRHETFKMRIRQ